MISFFSLMFYCLLLSGIILKMAHMIKDDSLQGQKSAAGSICKVPWRTLIIPAKELVQIIAKVLLYFVFCVYFLFPCSVLFVTLSLLVLLLLLKLGLTFIT